MAGVLTTEQVELVRTGDGGGSGRNDGGARGDGGHGGGSSDAAVPQRAYVTGMAVGLGGILMFFMALVSAYIVRKGLNNDWRALELPRILWLNTAVLILSSMTLARARRYFLRGDEDGFRHWWLVSTVLGVFFLIGQLIAWRDLRAVGIFLPTNPFSSFFYLFTAAHGLHLLGGIAVLSAVLWRTPRRLTQATATAIAAMYWHFMDGLWVFLFLLLTLGR